MISTLLSKEKQIAVVGLGYVGLPLALAFAKKFKVIGFDINASRVQLMQQQIDPSNELDAKDFEATDIHFTADANDLHAGDVFIVTVPTPVNEYNIPDLNPVLSATKTVAKYLKKGDYVIYESTVFPGCSEENCLPILEEISNLKINVDFKLGYSPERINPGDKKNTLKNITKIVSGSDEEAVDNIQYLYNEIIDAGTYKAKSIKVAEAAKVIENAQRDINIAFMNELSMIFDRMDISTQEVLDACKTKWNFLDFYPGLVGGHCIGVDPYYLSYKADQLGYRSEVILSGRRINDSMANYIAKRLVQHLIRLDKKVNEAKILIYGLTFKANVSDIRNSKIIDLIRELKAYQLTIDVIDPHAKKTDLDTQNDINLIENTKSKYDAVILAVPHNEFKNQSLSYYRELVEGPFVFYDFHAIYRNEKGLDENYWSL